MCNLFYMWKQRPENDRKSAARPTGELAISWAPSCSAAWAAASGEVFRVIDESGLTFSQMKVLLELEAADEDAEPSRPLAEEPRASRLPRRAARSTAWSGRSWPPGSRTPRTGGSAALALTAKGQELVDRIISARLAGLEALRRLARAARATEARRGARRAAGARGDRRDLRDLEGRSADDPLPPPDHRRQPQVVDARRDVLRAVHDHARQHRRERRAAVDPARPRTPRISEPRVDDQRLHALLRRPARDRRPARRHLRPPADVPDRRDHLRALLGDRRPRPGPDDADRQPRRPGRRRRADDARDALDHHQRLPGRTSAARRSAPGPASRRWRSRSARCSAASSPSTSAGARSSSSTSRSPSAPSPRRSSRCASRATRRSAARSTTPASARSPSSLTALVLALIEGNSWGWGSTGDRRPAGRRASIGAGRLRRDRAAGHGADGRVRALPRPATSSARTWSR